MHVSRSPSCDEGDHAGWGIGAGCTVTGETEAQVGLRCRIWALVHQRGHG